MENKFYCYKLTVSRRRDKKEKYYIGRTKNPKKRERTHRNLLKRGTHHNSQLNNFYQTGVTEVKLEIISEQKTLEESKQEEARIILKCLSDPDCVNIEVNGDTLTNHPERDSRIKRITKSLKKFHAGIPPEKRKEIYGKYGDRNGMYGRNHSPEAREKMSVATLTRYALNGPPNVGIKRSDSFKKACSERAKKRVGKLNPFYGKTHSKETREKIAKVHKGKIPANARKVSIEGVIYPSATEAGRKLNLHVTVITYRIKSKNQKFKNWMYL